MTFERQISSLTMLRRYVYWLYDRFIMEDEHRASEVVISFTLPPPHNSPRHAFLLLLLLLLFRLFDQPLVLTDAACFNAFCRQASALHVAAHRDRPAVNDIAHI